MKVNTLARQAARGVHTYVVALPCIHRPDCLPYRRCKPVVLHHIWPSLLDIDHTPRQSGINNCRHFLDFRPCTRDLLVLRDLPWLVVAHTPSFDNNLDHMEARQTASAGPRP